MTPTEAKMRMLAEWRTWVGHRHAPLPHADQDVGMFFDHIETNYPELLQFEGGEDKRVVVSRWLKDAGLIKN